MERKVLKTFKRISAGTIALGISASMLFSLSSCASLKMYFAGEVTDTGISIDSVASGKVYTPENSESNVAKSPYDTVYENCLFVGNTVMCDFYKTVEIWRESSSELFSRSYFFCNENFGVYENNYTKPSLASSHHPVLEYGDESVKCTVEEAVEKTGVSRVVFCLAGINDLPVYGDEENCHVKTAAEMAKLIRSLKEKFYGLSVVVLSTPPISDSSTQMKSVNNQKISQLNEEMSRVCTENGADFIDISSLMCNEKGALKEEFCSDGYCKLTEKGCKVILAALRYYAKERKGEI